MATSSLSDLLLLASCLCIIGVIGHELTPEHPVFTSNAAFGLVNNLCPTTGYIIFQHRIPSSEAGTVLSGINSICSPILNVSRIDFLPNGTLAPNSDGCYAVQLTVRGSFLESHPVQHSIDEEEEMAMMSPEEVDQCGHVTVSLRAYNSDGTFRRIAKVFMKRHTSFSHVFYFKGSWQHLQGKIQSTRCPVLQTWSGSGQVLVNYTTTIAN